METPSVKRRGKRGGPKKHRTWITIEEPTIAALRAQGETLGYSVSALAQLVLDRGVACGLINKDTPSAHGADVVRVTQDEHREHLNAEISRLHEKHVEILQDRLDLKEQRIAQLQQVLDMNALTITELSGDLQFYQQGRVHDAPVAHADDPGHETRGEE